MPDAFVWCMVLLSVLMSTAADTTSTYFWENHSTWLFVSVVLLSPCAFFCFGYVGAKFGLSIASSLTNSLIVLGPIVVGLLLRGEWKRVTTFQYAGMFCIILGITLIVLFKEKTLA
jgi:drug/metabolite transporter (DMT)-like permease